ncbi:hypothetical protein NIES4103_01630 [Nostoc sp. NIES-4103]|nr:hypothetical protein NIES4103_01630 [Nostoc sp. NIES-4103]
MHFLINELSFIVQAKDKYEADTLMGMLVKIIEELEPIRGKDRIQVHSSFSSCKLSIDFTVKDWVYEKLCSANRRDAKLFVEIMTKGPFIDRTLDHTLVYHECHLNNQDVTGSSLAGAAYLKGTVISLEDAPEFSSEHLQVRYSQDGEIYQNSLIPNLFHVSQAQKLRPRYVPSPKHSPPNGWGTIMDLSDEVAQLVLDKGIVSGKQIYGYYSEKFYEFQPDNADGYHGYPVAQNEVPPRIIKGLQKIQYQQDC